MKLFLACLCFLPLLSVTIIVTPAIMELLQNLFTSKAGIVFFLFFISVPLSLIGMCLLIDIKFDKQKRPPK